MRYALSTCAALVACGCVAGGVGSSPPGAPTASPAVGASSPFVRTSATPIGSADVSLQERCGLHGEGDLLGGEVPNGHSTCLLSRGCSSVEVNRIARCPAGIQATPISRVEGEELAEGQRVSLSGVLRKSLVGSGAEMIRCGIRCCEHRYVYLGLSADDDGARPTVILADDLYACAGDESLLCCRVDAVCSRVVATGSVIHVRPGVVGLKDVSLCRQ